MVDLDSLAGLVQHVRMVTLLYGEVQLIRLGMEITKLTDASMETITET